MSDGTRCIVRDLGLVKGGKGLKHHETLLVLSFKGLTTALSKQLLASFASSEKPRSRWLAPLRRGKAIEAAE